MSAENTLLQILQQLQQMNSRTAGSSVPRESSTASMQNRLSSSRSVAEQLGSNLGGVGSLAVSLRHGRELAEHTRKVTDALKSAAHYAQVMRDSNYASTTALKQFDRLTKEVMDAYTKGIERLGDSAPKLVKRHATEMTKAVKEALDQSMGTHGSRKAHPFIHAMHDMAKSGGDIVKVQQEHSRVLRNLADSTNNMQVSLASGQERFSRAREKAQKEYEAMVRNLVASGKDIGEARREAKKVQREALEAAGMEIAEDLKAATIAQREAMEAAEEAGYDMADVLGASTLSVIDNTEAIDENTFRKVLESNASEQLARANGALIPMIVAVGDAANEAASSLTANIAGMDATVKDFKDSLDSLKNGVAKFANNVLKPTIAVAIGSTMLSGNMDASVAGEFMARSARGLDGDRGDGTWWDERGRTLSYFYGKNVGSTSDLFTTAGVGYGGQAARGQAADRMARAAAEIESQKESVLAKIFGDRGGIMRQSLAAYNLDSKAAMEIAAAIDSAFIKMGTDISKRGSMSRVVDWGHMGIFAQETGLAATSAEGVQQLLAPLTENLDMWRIYSAHGTRTEEQMRRETMLRQKQALVLGMSIEQFDAMNVTLEKNRQGMMKDKLGGMGKRLASLHMLGASPEIMAAAQRLEYAMLAGKSVVGSEDQQLVYQFMQSSTAARDKNAFAHGDLHYQLIRQTGDVAGAMAYYGSSSSNEFDANALWTQQQARKMDASAVEKAWEDAAERIRAGSDDWVTAMSVAMSRIQGLASDTVTATLATLTGTLGHFIAGVLAHRYGGRIFRGGAGLATGLWRWGKGLIGRGGRGGGGGGSTRAPNVKAPTSTPSWTTSPGAVGPGPVAAAKPGMFSRLKGLTSWKKALIAGTLYTGGSMYAGDAVASSLDPSSVGYDPSTALVNTGLDMMDTIGLAGLTSWGGSWALKKLGMQGLARGAGLLNPIGAAVAGLQLGSAATDFNTYARSDNAGWLAKSLNAINPSNWSDALLNADAGSSTGTFADKVMSNITGNKVTSAMMAPYRLVQNLGVLGGIAADKITGNEYGEGWGGLINPFTGKTIAQAAFEATRSSTPIAPNADFKTADEGILMQSDEVQEKIAAGVGGVKDAITSTSEQQAILLERMASAMDAMLGVQLATSNLGAREQAKLLRNFQGDRNYFPGMNNAY